MKKTILHVIESLSIGGAEVLLTESLKCISADYRHVLVYLRPPATLLSEVKADKVYCLGYKGKSNIMLCVFRLRNIIQKENINLIHAHHYWPTIVARLAKPRKIPLVFTVHNLLSFDAFMLNRLSLYLERLTYRKEHHAVFVSRAVMEDYKKYIKLGGKATVIYNFVSDKFYKHEFTKSVGCTKSFLQLVAVGTLKNQKNYYFLLDVFKLLKGEKIYLDIIGDGPLRKDLQAVLVGEKLNNVKLKGASDNVVEHLSQYDAFILASTYEGMSLGIIEAMAVGLPCILSDIPSNREVAEGAAVYFSLSSPEECAQKLIVLLHHQSKLAEMSVASKRQSVEFKKVNYLLKLEGLYNHYL